VIQQWTLRLLFGAVALPILICLLSGVGYLFTALDDGDGALAVRRINLGLAVLWVFDLLMLLVVMALQSLLSIEERSDTREHSNDPDQHTHEG